MEKNVEEGTGGEIVLYRPDENITMEVRLDVSHDTVWLNRQQMAELFERDVKTIGKHINNALNEELADDSVVANNATTQKKVENPTIAKFATVQREGERIVTRQVEYYNLDVILSVGYRVKSNRGVQFRRWANHILKQHLLNGYTLNRHLVALQQHVDDRLLKIEDRLDRQQEDIDFYIKTNQQPSELVIPTGCVWDAYSYMSDLVRTAKRRIVLIDNFVDDRTLLLLDKRGARVDATVYTRYSEKTELDFTKHNAQYEPVKCVQLPHAVHDRYMIVDDSVWLLGSSVKDMGRGLTTIIRTEIEPEYILGCVK
ncbi:MAG: virulence RhuM family protein [Bacteroidales bacterium]|nr:virulence RhuM family protein [Bacteroidales bacterium]